MRPFLVMSPDEREVVERVFERATVKRMVRNGRAEWLAGRRAVRLISQDKKWRPRDCAGATVMQLVDG